MSKKLAKPRIIHYFDDDKFIDSQYVVFEDLFPDCNEYYFLDCPSRKPKYVKMKKKYVFEDDLDKSISNIPNDNTIVVIFHSLPNHWLEKIKNIPENVKVVWREFGYEVYYDKNLYSQHKLYDKCTYSFQKNEELKALQLSSIENKSLFDRVKTSRTEKNNKIANFGRVDFLYFAIKEEYSLVKKIIKNKNLKYARTWEFDSEFFEKSLVKDMKKNIIMIGHSASPAVNHLDTFKKLEKNGVANKEITIPISYGGSPEYISKLKNDQFVKNNRTKFLDEFMPLEKYNKLQNQIKIAVFNARRQMAGGNIVNLLYLGAKLFVSEKNSFYWWAKHNDFVIYSYEKELNKNEIKNGLTASEISFNRKKIIEISRKYKANNKSEIQKIINYNRDKMV